MAAILEVDALERRYGSFVAVAGLSFAVERGEVFGLLGPNGAGKSTTISMLCGLLAPSGGRARICGFDVVAERDEVKRRIGFVPQDLALYPTLSARQNLTFFGRLYGLGGKLLRARVEEALEAVALRERATQAVASYSGGMKRRLNIAAGLLHHPELLFLDEPTVGVDPQSRQHIFEHVERLNRDGMTVVYTSHYMEEVERLCRRLAIVDHGRVIAEGTPRALMASVAGGVIELRLAEGECERLAERAREHPRVRSVRAAEGSVAIEVDGAESALADMFHAASELGLRVSSASVLQPSLETVFLHLTGRSLRE